MLNFVLQFLDIGKTFLIIHARTHTMQGSPFSHYTCPNVYTSCNVWPHVRKVSWRWVQWISICSSTKDVLMLQNKTAVGYHWYWPWVWPRSHQKPRTVTLQGGKKYTRPWVTCFDRAFKMACRFELCSKLFWISNWIALNLWSSLQQLSQVSGI